jgi:hypothetical protein
VELTIFDFEASLGFVAFALEVLAAFVPRSVPERRVAPSDTCLEMRWDAFACNILF